MNFHHLALFHSVTIIFVFVHHYRRFLANTLGRGFFRNGSYQSTENSRKSDEGLDNSRGSVNNGIIIIFLRNVFSRD